MVNIREPKVGDIIFRAEYINYDKPPGCDEEALRQMCRILDPPEPETFSK